MKKYITVDIGLGIEVKEVKPSLFNKEYIKKSIVFITVVMIYFTTLAWFITQCVK